MLCQRVMLQAKAKGCPRHFSLASPSKMVFFEDPPIPSLKFFDDDVGQSSTEHHGIAVMAIKDSKRAALKQRSGLLAEETEDNLWRWEI